MNLPEPKISVNVELSNPGQFFACCGLLEVAHRIWPGAEGWFTSTPSLFEMCAEGEGYLGFKHIAEELARTPVEGDLTKDEQKELDDLERRRRVLARADEKVAEQAEERRSYLGKRRREGAIRFGEPLNLRLAWWQEEGEHVPKTFAGRQEVLRMALAMRLAIPAAAQAARPLEYRCLLQAADADVQSTEARPGKRRQRPGSKVEPFYFDAQRYAHPLDAGFSLDVQEKTMRSCAAPMTELMALIGLQRFRPRPTTEDKWTFEYFTWDRPLGVAAAAAACGGVPLPGSRGYRFRLQFRDDQKRYKAFGFATAAA